MKAYHFPPGPEVRPLKALLSGRSPLGADRLNFMSRMFSDYGEAVRYRFGRLNIFLFFHPDAIHEVLVSQADRFYKSLLTKRLLGQLMGQGLLLTEDETWKRQRRLVQPAFHMKRIEAYAGVMVEHAARLAADWQRGPSTRDAAEEMMALTLGIVAKTLFDADVSGETGRVASAMARLQALVNQATQTILPLPDWVPTPLNMQGARARQVLDEIVMGMIDERRTSGEDRGDLLSMLLMAQDEEGTGGLTDREVRDEAMTLFLAGHETTALTMTWTWVLLAQNPRAEAKLHEELDRVLAGRLPAIHDLPDLPYTEMVVRESMRLYPPAYVVARYCIADAKIGGYDVPAGSALLLSPYVTHHDPRWWPNPQEFEPERFSAGWEERLPRYAYFPFGGGPRICIGNSFAHMEARLLLATLAQRFSLRVAPGQVIEPEPLITLRPKHGMRMEISAREAAAPLAAPKIQAVAA